MKYVGAEEIYKHINSSIHNNSHKFISTEQKWNLTPQDFTICIECPNTIIFRVFSTIFKEEKMCTHIHYWGQGFESMIFNVYKCGKCNTLAIGQNKPQLISYPKYSCGEILSKEIL
jgi:hypothetical protein